MKKIICKNCNSNDISFRAKYYECNHCHTKYRLPPEMRRERSKEIEDNSKESLGTYKIIAVGVIFAVAIGVFGQYLFQNQTQNIETISNQQKYSTQYTPIKETPILINNTNAHIESQSIVINNYNTTPKQNSKEMDYWNIMFKRDKLLGIKSLYATHLDSYLVVGDGRDGLNLMELDRNGNEIWSRSFISTYHNARKQAIMVGDNYLVTYEGGDGLDQTIMLGSDKKILFRVPIFFDSILSTDDGFVGVTQKEIMKINTKGKTIWKKSLNRIHPIHFAYNLITRLQDNTIVEMGIDKKNILWSTKYNQNGEILWQHKVSTYQTSVRNLIPTTDGGFLLTADRYVKIFKFNSKGELEWSNNFHKYKNPSVSSIVEIEDGYMLIARESYGVLVAKLDFEGNYIWDKVYKSKKRLFPTNIVKAVDSGYLLSVNTELGHSWVVKIGNRGEIRDAFDEENYSFSSNNRVFYKKKRSHQDKIITNNTHLGGMCSHIHLSKEENYLYASTMAGGFYIFDLKDKTHPKQISLFSKSKTKFGFYPSGAFGPINRSVYQLKGEYDYNRPQTFILSEDESRAFVIDITHGFYILDISDKKDPKLLASLKDIKGTSMILSKDQRSILIPTVDIEKGHIDLIAIDIDNPKNYYTYPTIQVEKKRKIISPDHYNYLDNPTRIVMLPSNNTVAISYLKSLITFDLNKKRVIKQTKVARNIYDMKLSHNQQSLYLSLPIGVELYDIETLNIKNHIETGGGYRPFCELSDEDKILYTSPKEGGLQLMSLQDQENPQKIITYKNMTGGGAFDIALSRDKKRLYVGFGEGVSVIER